MAITVDWPNQIINIPRADLQLVQSTPTEIRQLDVDVFRLTLKGLEDDEIGMAFPRTHNHVGPISVGGVSLARVVEIINGYTVTFEDGQYAVNLVGANNNIGDVVNVNQVSVRSSNSAGLTYSKQVEDQSFYDSRVYINTIAGLPGVVFPRGTPGDPVDNLADALTIIQQRRLPKRLFLRGALTVPSGTDVTNFDIVGSSPILASMDFDNTSLTTNLVVAALTVTGDLSGDLTAKKSTTLVNLNEFSGAMSNCGIDGTITIADNKKVTLVNCHSEIAGDARPVIVMGANTELILRNFSGGVEIRSATAGCKMSVDLDPGKLVLDASNTGGELLVRGSGVLVDNSAGLNVVNAGLVDGNVVAAIYDIEYGEWEVTANQMVFRDPAGVEVARFDLFDQAGLPAVTDVFHRTPV